MAEFKIFVSQRVLSVTGGHIRIDQTHKRFAQEIRGFEKMPLQMDLKWNITQNVCAVRSSGQMS